MKCRWCRLELVLTTRVDVVDGLERSFWVPVIRPSNLFCLIEGLPSFSHLLHMPRDEDVREDLRRLATE